MIFILQETGQDISAQIFNGCGKPQLNPESVPRKRRSISPKLLLADKRYFDDISNRNGGEESVENFSFVDEETGLNGDYLSGSNSAMHAINRFKRQTVPAQTERANSRDLIFEPLQFDGESEEEELPTNSNNRGRKKNKNNNRNGGNSPAKSRNDDDNEDNKEPPLDKLVKDIRTKVKDSKKFWSNLPYQICNNEDIDASSSNDNCWNGNKIDR